MFDWMKNEHKTRSGLNAVINRTTIYHGVMTHFGFVWDDFECGGDKRPGPMKPCCWKRDGKCYDLGHRYDIMEAGHA